MLLECYHKLCSLIGQNCVQNTHRDGYARDEYVRDGYVRDGYVRDGYVRFQDEELNKGDISAENENRFDQSSEEINAADDDLLEEFFLFDSLDTIYEEFPELEDVPNKFQWMWQCIIFTLSILFVSVLCIASVQCGIVFLYLNMASVCVGFKGTWYELPLLVRRIRITCNVITQFFIQMWFPVFILSIFSWKFVRQLLIFKIHMHIAGLLIIIELISHVFHSYGGVWQTYISHSIFCVTILISSWIVSVKLSDSRKKRIKYVLTICAQFLFGLLFSVSFFDIFVPALIKSRYTLLTITFMIGYILRLTCRVVSENTDNITHPGKLYLLSYIINAGTMFIFRIVQASFLRMSEFLIISAILGLIISLERISRLFSDYMITCLYRKSSKEKSITHKLYAQNKTCYSRYDSKWTEYRCYGDSCRKCVLSVLFTRAWLSSRSRNM